MGHERITEDIDGDRSTDPSATNKAPLGDSSSEEDEDESNPEQNRPPKRSYWQEFVDYVLNGSVIILVYL